VAPVTPDPGRSIDFRRPAAGDWSQSWRSFSSSRGPVLGLLVILTFTGLAIGADWIAPYSPSEQFRDAFLAPPAWAEGGSARFLLGTDPLGRDILSRIIHGARVSLGIGLAAVLAASLLGVLLGLAAGYLRGMVDALVMRLMDVMLALPSLLLAIVVVAILGPALINAAAAVVAVQVPHFVRLTRAAVRAELVKDYVTASRLCGAGPLRIAFRTVLPNCAAPLIVQATLGFSTAVLDLAALGFLGLGAQPPTPEWGTMLADSRSFVLRAWWVVTFPGLAILTTVLAFNLLGDGLRDALDPRLRR
jgi:dipeptide transport system permease protein